MTDRYAGYVVTMEDDQRSDDVEATINAIRMVRGVIDVKPVRMTLGEALDYVGCLTGALCAEAKIGDGVGDMCRIMYHADQKNPKLCITMCGAPVSEIPANLDWCLRAVSKTEKSDG